MSETALPLLAILTASLLGSAHCAAMCGGFAAVVGGHGALETPYARRVVARTVAYHLGRLLAYATLGAAAGGLASGLDAAGETLLGVSRVATLALGVVLIYLGLRAGGWLPGSLTPQPTGLVTLTERPAAHSGARLLARMRAGLRRRWSTLLRKPGAAAAGAVGLLSGLLPCGWLWGFLALAGAAGSALTGAAVMAAFWIGTVPLLSAVGGLAGVFGHRLRRHARGLTAGALLFAGALTLIGRGGPAFLPDDAAETGANTDCHTGTPALLAPASLRRDDPAPANPAPTHARLNPRGDHQ